VNWARRTHCNLCNNPKFAKAEQRTGKLWVYCQIFWHHVHVVEASALYSMVTVRILSRKAFNLTLHELCLHNNSMLMVVRVSCLISFLQHWQICMCTILYCAGYGGGFMERDEVVEYVERNDSDDEFDEVTCWCFDFLFLWAANCYRFRSSVS